MTNNKQEPNSKRKLWNNIGWGIALFPFILLAVGPDSYSYRGDSHGAGVAIFLFFLSIPAGLLVSLVGHRPKLARIIFLIIGGAVLLLFVLSAITNLNQTT
jgi:predicted membrane channel-forming protein YqfA (hemolysin III family)